MTDLPRLNAADLDATACRRLWCAVLLESLKNSTGILPTNLTPGMRQAELQRSQAYFRTSDFEVVADLAGINPAVIQQAIRRGAINREAVGYLTTQARGPQISAPKGIA